MLTFLYQFSYKYAHPYARGGYTNPIENQEILYTVAFTFTNKTLKKIYCATLLYLQVLNLLIWDMYSWTKYVTFTFETDIPLYS